MIVVNLIVVKLIYHHGVTNVNITRRSRQGEFRVKQAVCLGGGVGEHEGYLAAAISFSFYSDGVKGRRKSTGHLQ